MEDIYFNIISECFYFWWWLCNCYVDEKEVYKKLDAVEKIDEDYMEYVDTFCEKYCKYIEGGNPEYFRYPEYKSSQYFAGNCLDAKWLSYNFALILLKLLHLADLEKEI